jgi:hypothetical protein
MAAKINGFSLAYTATGAVVLWSGIKGWTISETFRSLLSGKTPVSNAEPISITSVEQGAAVQGDLNTGTSVPGVTAGIPPGVASTSGMQALQKAAAAHGWGSGAEWNALVYVEMREAGFSLTATNPTSGAYGMAQFINGPSEYYQYGGNPDTYDGQATAMCNYIEERYGDPIAAANHERTYNWY